MRDLARELGEKGWSVLRILLRQLLMDRIRKSDPRFIESAVATELRLQSRGPERGLNFLRERIGTLVEGEGGIVVDVVALVNAFADRHPDAVDRTLIVIERAGAFYPFFRSSAMLKHIDGKTRGIPVVLLYPGVRTDPTGSALSFMGDLAADRDYRPRICPWPRRARCPGRRAIIHPEPRLALPWRSPHDRSLPARPQSVAEVRRLLFPSGQSAASPVAVTRALLAKIER